MKLYKILLFATFVAGVLCDEYEDNIEFLVYHQVPGESATSADTLNYLNFTSTFSDGESLMKVCPFNSSITIMVHGYTEAPTISWASPLVKSFLFTRGGCVIWMDYSFYGGKSIFTSPPYETLVAHFNGIRSVLTKKMVQLDTFGYDPKNWHVFGLSFGSQLIMEAGYQFTQVTKKLVDRIDACDPAGPSFTMDSPSVIHASTAARHTQCIHTCKILGTSFRTCQKNINMGNCGKIQLAGLIPPKSHTLCPVFYNNAFLNNFTLVPKSTIESHYSTFLYKLKCDAVTSPPLTNPKTFSAPKRMGYYLDFSIPDGQYYAMTSPSAPYNVL